MSMRKWLLILAWPVMARAQKVQTVQPVINDDYLALILKDSAAAKKQPDTIHNMNRAGLVYDYYGNYYSYNNKVKFIRTGPGNKLVLIPYKDEFIAINSSIALTTEWQQRSHMPALQNEYAQGRSINGSLQWQGPHTNELFSFGPSIHALVYDGSSYAWDNKGQLIPAAQGSSQAATAYANKLLRKGFVFTRSGSLQLTHIKNYKRDMYVLLRGSNGNERTLIPINASRISSYSILLNNTMLRNLELSGNYQWERQHYTQSNRTGLISRAYQYSLLSPVSFDIHQGSMIGNNQRSYSMYADNPLFLLDDARHGFTETRKNSSMSVLYKKSKVQFKITPSYERLLRHSNESYKAGTAFFPSGAAMDRNTNDRTITLNSSFQLNRFYIGDRINLSATIAHTLNDDRSEILYASYNKAWHYHRSSSNFSLLLMPEYRNGDVEAGISTGNKFYHSGTATRHYSFLPSASGYINLTSPFNWNRTQLKLYGGYNVSANEPSVHRSYSGYTLTTYSVADAMQYLPLQEVNSFNGLQPVRHRDGNAGISFFLYSKGEFNVSWFSRRSRNDIFPVMNGNNIELVNMATHRSRGMELELQLYPNIWAKNAKKLFFTNTISFTRYRNKVLSVKDGYNHTALAGFHDVHKTLVAGYAPGVITGSSWLRNAAGEKIIGADGFPQVNNTPAVIGDPNPDFTFKLSNRLSWKNQLTFFIDWEWQKGGKVWNGTRALLDYYGRSKASGEQRSITNYVFAGVTAAGAHNSTPVSFYNSSLPVEQNRWVRYGPGGVTEDYMEDGSSIRINTLSISYKPKLKTKTAQVSFSLYAANLLLWSPYKGADPRQLLYDMPGSGGLDFFNLPAVSTAGFSTTFQF